MKTRCWSREGCPTPDACGCVNLLDSTTTTPQERCVAPFPPQIGFVELKLNVPLPGTQIEIRLRGFSYEQSSFGMAALRRFCRVFDGVWEMIPHIDHLAIEEYWLERIPRMEIHGVWSGKPTAIADTRVDGEEIRFRWEMCRLMPDEVLAAVIAHEMAHVYQAAVGKEINITVADLLETLPFNEYFPLKDDGLYELHADEVMTKWGFCYVRYHAYLEKHYWMNKEGFLRRKKAEWLSSATKVARKRRNESRYIRLKWTP